MVDDAFVDVQGWLGAAGVADGGAILLAFGGHRGLGRPGGSRRLGEDEGLEGRRWSGGCRTSGLLAGPLGRSGG